MKNVNRTFVLAYYWQTAKRAAGGITIAVAIVTLLYCVQVLLPLRRVKDASSAPIQQSVGTVVRIVYRSTTRGNAPLNINYLTIRFHGQDIVYESPALVTVGEPVRVYYQVGKSGAVYIDNIAPAQP